MKHIVEAGKRAAFSFAQILASSFRRRGNYVNGEIRPPAPNMWVTWRDEHVAILLDLLPNDLVRIQLVDRQGVNLEELITHADGKQAVVNLVRDVPASQVRQAWFDEIPAARMLGHEDPERTFSMMGYLRKPK